MMLEGPVRPVVLCAARSDAPLASGVTNGLATVGLMLPATPIHALLFHALLGTPQGSDWRTAPADLALVMTSANRSGDPLIIDDAEAKTGLSEIADAVAGHDRPILVRADDSVVRIVAGAPMVVRRARGYAPEPIRLHQPLPPTLALGAHLKATVTVTRGDAAFLSQHVGDLDTPAVRTFLEETVDHLLRLTTVRPSRIACDLHPDFASSRMAVDLAERFQVPLISVQHHHAHVAAVTAEHGHDGPVLGLALDGFGLGSDGGAWGGELLLCDGARVERLGHLATFQQPGGDTASREPWRMAAALLHRLGRSDEIPKRFAQEPQAARVAQLLGTGLAPETSSAGRLFDAVAGLLGICDRQHFEGEAPMRLEGLVTEPRVLADGWTVDGGCLSLDPLLQALAEVGDPEAGANLLHGTLAAALADWAADSAGAQGVQTIALGGGCWINAVLSGLVCADLRARGFTVLLPRLVPPGDGGISFGQAVIAGQTTL